MAAVCRPPLCPAQRSGGAGCSLWEDSGFPRKQSGGFADAAVVLGSSVRNLWHRPLFPHSGLLFVTSIQINIDLFGLKGTNAVDHQVDGQFDLWPRGRSSRQPSENRGYIIELMKKKKRLIDYRDDVTHKTSSVFLFMSNNIRDLARSSLPPQRGRGLAGKVIVIITRAPLQLPQRWRMAVVLWVISSTVPVQTATGALPPTVIAPDQTIRFWG